MTKRLGAGPASSATAARLQAQGRGVFAACAGCRRGRTLDLSAIIASGQGDIDIHALCAEGRFRCGYCGADRLALHIDP